MFPSLSFPRRGFGRAARSGVAPTVTNATVASPETQRPATSQVQAVLRS